MTDARPIRSMLFVPGDSEKKLGKAENSGADALILDLEDSVVSARKTTGRAMVADFLTHHPRGRRSMQLWVRVNPLSTPLVLEDLVAITGGAPDGIMLPKADGPDDVHTVSNYLDALEAQAGVEARSIRILPVATETAIAPFRLGDYATAGLARLAGLTWGAEDLSAAVGASSNVDTSGQWALTYRLVRSATLLAAHAARVPAVETLYVDYKDEAGLRASCLEARMEGWSGRIAIHPDQVATINECFMPSGEQVEHARRVIAAFDASDGAGTVGVDGRMLDIPHLKQARSVLMQWEMFSERRDSMTNIA